MGYRHYLRTDANGIVVKGFTDGFIKQNGGSEDILPGDLELQGYDTRQFQLQLTNDRGQYKYKMVNSQMTARTQAELDSEWSARPVPPDPDKDLADAITAATTLPELKAALLGNSGKLARVPGKMK